MRKIPTQFKIGADEKELFTAIGKERDITFSAFIRKAARMYAKFPAEFMELMDAQAKEMGMEVADLIACIVQHHFCMNAAFRTVFGTESKSFTRPFKWENGKMVRDFRLSEILFDEYAELYAGLKEKLVRTTENPSRAAAFEASVDEVQAIAATM